MLTFILHIHYCRIRLIKPVSPFASQSHFRDFFACFISLPFLLRWIGEGKSSRPTKASVFFLPHGNIFDIKTSTERQICEAEDEPDSSWWTTPRCGCSSTSVDESTNMQHTHELQRWFPWEGHFLWALSHTRWRSEGSCMFNKVSCIIFSFHTDVSLADKHTV